MYLWKARVEGGEGAALESLVLLLPDILVS